MREVGVGLIGTGFMGKCHALAFRAAPAVFEGTIATRLELLADLDPATLATCAPAWGFARSTTDWRELIADPAVDVMAITTPNFLHQPMALEAIAAGKHVYCEKPLALDTAGAGAMAAAARAAGVVTLVGYNYLRSPAVQLAHDMIQAGELGDVIYFRGAHVEDFLANPAVPASWRLRRATAGAGALGDMGSHVVSLARHLVGRIEEVMGAQQTVIAERPAADGSGGREPVDVDDQAQALLRFASGAAGTFETSWLGHGRKMGLTFEILGSKGAIAFDQERMNEVRLFQGGAPGRLNGFRTVLIGPEHPPYAAFCPAPGHQLGFNELKVVEVKALLDAIAGGTEAEPDFAAGHEIASVIEAIQVSAVERRWVRPEEIVAARDARREPPGGG